MYSDARYANPIYDINNYGVPDENPFEDPVLPYWRNGGTRTFIVGTPGSGKSNLICDILYTKLKYDNLFYYAPEASLHQDKLEQLKDAYLLIKPKYSDRTKSVEFIFTSNIDDIKLDLMNPDERNVIVLDDALSLNTKAQIARLNMLLTTTRHNNAIVFVLSQEYFDIPKTSRNNCNLFMLFKVNSKFQLQSIYRDSPLEISYREFVRLKNIVARTQFNFLTIDKREDAPNELKIRDGLRPFPNGVVQYD